MCRLKYTGRPQVYCDNEECNWKGGIVELVTFELSYRQLCPRCGKPDSITEGDGVNFVDYLNQEGGWGV